MNGRRMIDPMYTAKPVGTIKNAPGTWDSYWIGVFDGDREIGRYKRNYSFLSTFFPFKQGDQWLALYSPEYTATRILKLPECVDLGGERADAFGFCPVEYYVPNKNRDDEDLPQTVGFVAGCVWGDDASWKIQMLDLSKAKEGVVVRSEKFGYIQLPHGLSLREAISIENDEHTIYYYIAAQRIYRQDFENGVEVKFTDFTD